MLFFINCLVIELVLSDLYLKRSDLTKSLLFNTFFITVGYKLCCCDHRVIRIVFTTNKLVDRIKSAKMVKIETC